MKPATKRVESLALILFDVAFHKRNRKLMLRTRQSIHRIRVGFTLCCDLLDRAGFTHVRGHSDETGKRIHPQGRGVTETRAEP